MGLLDLFRKPQRCVDPFAGMRASSCVEPLPLSMQGANASTIFQFAVGVSSVQVLAANPKRIGLNITNTSGNVVSISFGNLASLNAGITLTPNGSFWMDDGSFSAAAVYAIATAGNSILAIQEF